MQINSNSLIVKMIQNSFWFLEPHCVPKPTTSCGLFLAGVASGLWHVAYTFFVSCFVTGLFLGLTIITGFSVGYDLSLLPDTMRIILTMGIVVFLLAKGRLTPKAFVNFVSILSIFAPFGYLLYIGTSKKTTPKEKKKIIPFAALFVCNCFTLMIWGQAVSILLVFAEERVNNSLMGISFAPAAWITISSFFSILFGTLTGSIWTKLGNKQPSTASKFGMGTIFYGLASMFMAVPIILYPGNVKIMGLWILIFFIILIFGESISSPIGLGFATAVSPKAFTAQMVTVWQLGLSTGAGVASLSINFYTQGQEATFFLASGLITIIVGASLLLIRKPIMKIAAE